MILRRVGSRMQPVVPDFDPRALTEITFRPGAGPALQAADFDERYTRVGGRELSTEADGMVQGEAEEALVRGLEEKLRQLEASLGPGEVLVIESRPGVDYPKTRERTENVIIEGENRLHFYWRVEPPLRVGIFRPRNGLS